MATQKVQSTKNYRLFNNSHDNRPVDIKKHRPLQASMRQYGFLPCYPIIVSRNGAKNLTVKDGQHRLAIAEMLGLPVYWIEDESDFDIGTVNRTAKGWSIEDYTRKFAENGNREYQELLDFAEVNRIPITMCAVILSGECKWGTIRDKFCSGGFTIKDRNLAAKVASLYVQITELSCHVRTVRFLEACIAACYAIDFEPQRLIQNAKRCREKLVAYSTRDAYLDMIEDVYNFGRSKLVGIKAAALMALRERNPVKQKTTT